MKKSVKAEIKANVDKAVSGVVESLHVARPSKKTRKAIDKVAKNLTRDIKDEKRKVEKEEKKEVKKVEKEARRAAKKESKLNS